jgi:hypothetical protein
MTDAELGAALVEAQGHLIVHSWVMPPAGAVVPICYQGNPVGAFGQVVRASSLAEMQAQDLLSARLDTARNIIPSVFVDCIFICVVPVD